MLEEFGTNYLDGLSLSIVEILFRRMERNSSISPSKLQMKCQICWKNLVPIIWIYGLSMWTVEILFGRMERNSSISPSKLQMKLCQICWKNLVPIIWIYGLSMWTVEILFGRMERNSSISSSKLQMPDMLEEFGTNYLHVRSMWTVDCPRSSTSISSAADQSLSGSLLMPLICQDQC